MKGLKLMIISGLLKTTLLDYPQHVAATIFLGGCNFRCPFCHNSDLLEGTDGLFSKRGGSDIPEKKSRYPGGVCITGGEPTLHRDLEPFIRKSAVSVFWLNWIPTDTGRMYKRIYAIKICWIMWQWILSQAGPGTPKQPASRVSTCHI